MNTEAFLPEHVTAKLSRLFGCRPESLNAVCIRKGNWCNASLYQVELAGKKRVAKEFYSRHFLVRETVGRWLIAREYEALTKLTGLQGIPSGVHRLSPYALVIDFVAGRTLGEYRRQRDLLPKRFFEEMERRVGAMHQRGVSHLDLRNLSNVICGEDGHPYFIDFQTRFNTQWLPPFVRKAIQEIDYSAITKGWIKLCEEPLDPMRAERWKTFNRFRKLWIFEGYWLSKILRKMCNKTHHVKQNMDCQQDLDLVP